MQERTDRAVTPPPPRVKRYRTVPRRKIRESDGKEGLLTCPLHLSSAVDLFPLSAQLANASHKPQHPRSRCYLSGAFTEQKP